MDNLNFEPSAPDVTPITMDSLRDKLLYHQNAVDALKRVIQMLECDEYVTPQIETTKAVKFMPIVISILKDSIVPLKIDDIIEELDKREISVGRQHLYSRISYYIQRGVIKNIKKGKADGKAEYVVVNQSLKIA